MSIITIILLAVGLAMDCFAVSVCKGLTSPHGYVPRYIKPMLMALLFGVFHAGFQLGEGGIAGGDGRLQLQICLRDFQLRGGAKLKESLGVSGVLFRHGNLLG